MRRASTVIAVAATTTTTTTSTTLPSMSVRGNTPLSRSATPDPMQRNFPTRTEWESWKDTIRELYIERNMTLSRLRDHMAQAYGFHAEDHEYKRRLSQWQFRKNYTSAQKEAVAVHLDNYRAQQQHAAEPEIRLNNMPVRMDKIERHRKAARRKSNRTVAFHLNADPSPESEFPMSLRGESHLDISEHQITQAQPHQQQQLMTAPASHYTFPSMDHPESMMWNVNQFDQSRRDDMMMTSTPSLMQTQNRLDVAMYNIVKAVDAFGAGDSSSAVQILDEYCNSVQNLLQTDTSNFMMYMTVLQTLPVWNRAQCRDLYQYLYSIFARMSYQALGQRHPVTSYLRTTADYDARQATLGKACLLVLELGAQHFASAHTMIKHPGGIPIDAEGRLDFCLLPSDRDSSSSRLRGRDRPILDRQVEEMARLLRDGWYSQSLGDAASVVSKIKKTLEDYVRRVVESLNASISMTTTTATTLESQRYLGSNVVNTTNTNTANQASMAMMTTSMSDPRQFPINRPR